MNQPSFLLMAHSFTSRPRSNRLGIFFHFFPQASQFKFKLHLGSLGKQHAKWILVFAVDAEGACHGNPTTFRKETTFSTGYSEGATLKKPFLLSGVGVFFVCTKQLVTCARAHTHTRRSFDNISIVNGVRKFSLNLTISEVLAAMEDMEDFELNVSTLEGGVITVQVTPTNTIEELKTMLCEKKAEHPNEVKILTAEVLVGGALVNSESQTLEAAGLLDAEFEVTVVYSRNQVEAATKKEIYREGFVEVNIPASLVEISARAFENCDQVVKVESLSLWRPLGKVPLNGAVLWQALLSLSLWRLLETVPLQGAVLFRASLSQCLWQPLDDVPLRSAGLWTASVSLSLLRP